MPTVLIDSQHPKLDRINVDDRCGGKLVTDYLIGLGHKKIGFISSHLNNPLQFSSTIYRYQGYCDALKAAKLPINPNYQEEGEHGREEAKRMALEMLSRDDPPTAIFASSDSKAIGVLDAARELNLSVPEDLSVVGYDDIRDAEYVNLTTVHQPLFKAGRLGGRKLVSLINNPGSAPEEVLLPLELVVRGTTAPPAA
jgi:DNA-binding LacI/PurR family transcriptional regulator